MNEPLPSYILEEFIRARNNHMINTGNFPKRCWLISADRVDQYLSDERFTEGHSNMWRKADSDVLEVMGLPVGKVVGVSGIFMCL